MDIEPRDDDKFGCSRPLVSKKNIENTLDRPGQRDVFHRADVAKGLMQDMIRRQMTFIGHVIPKDELEKVVLTGYVEGTRDLGKQRENFSRISANKKVYYLVRLYVKS